MYFSCPARQALQSCRQWAGSSPISHQDFYSQWPPASPFSLLCPLYAHWPPCFVSGRSHSNRFMSIIGRTGWDALSHHCQIRALLAAKERAERDVKSSNYAMCMAGTNKRVDRTRARCIYTCQVTKLEPLDKWSRHKDLISPEVSQNYTVTPSSYPSHSLAVFSSSDLLLLLLLLFSELLSILHPTCPDWQEIRRCRWVDNFHPDRIWYVRPGFQLLVALCGELHYISVRRTILKLTQSVKTYQSHNLCFMVVSCSLRLRFTFTKHWW